MLPKNIKIIEELKVNLKAAGSSSEAVALAVHILTDFIIRAEKGLVTKKEFDKIINTLCNQHSDPAVAREMVKRWIREIRAAELN
jgi:hypothetical protein